MRDTTTETTQTTTDMPDPSAGASPARPLAPGLYLVATPIGNLEDMTLRGLRVLGSCDRIACEDTRQSARLLSHYGITTPTVSYHLHNEEGRATELVELLRAGGRVAVISDAGTPGIADPGVTLVRAAVAAGVPVFPIPGANAALNALAASGLGTDRFSFIGFLPSKGGQRRSLLEALRAETTGAAGTGAAGRGTAGAVTLVAYETPHRIVEALADMVAVFGASQPVVLARELTKLHEEFLRGTASELHRELTARSSVRGEMVLLWEPAAPAADSSTHGSLAAEVRAAIATGLSEKDALKQVARGRGLGKSEAYREWQRTSRTGNRS